MGVYDESDRVNRRRRLLDFTTTRRRWDPQSKTRLPETTRQSLHYLFRLLLNRGLVLPPSVGEGFVSQATLALDALPSRDRGWTLPNPMNPVPRLNLDLKVGGRRSRRVFASLLLYLSRGSSVLPGLSVCDLSVTVEYGVGCRWGSSSMRLIRQKSAPQFRVSPWASMCRSSTVLVLPVWG